jgi:ankyrin repeat protein
MFNSWFKNKDIVEKRKDAINNMFYYAAKKTNNYVLKIIIDNDFDLNSSECIDFYGNSLLHIVAKNDNFNLATELVNIGVNKNHSNMFNEIPLDVAIKFKSINVIRILLNCFNNEELLKKVKYLEKDNHELKTQYVKLMNIKDTKKDQVLELEVIERALRKNLKRKREECDTLNKSLKKHKVDNAKLSEDNKVLVDTVKNLKESFKKK